MKKIALILMTALFAVTLCSCKSDEAKTVEALISEVGDITTENFNADGLIAAQNAYNALSEEDKKDVDNYDILLKAKEDVLSIFKAEIEQSFTSGDMKTAYTCCVGALEYGFNFSEEENDLLRDMLTTIESVCFPGTYIVQPENIISVDIERVDDSMADVGDLLDVDEEGIWIAYYFDKSSETKLAGQQYMSYLNNNYQLIDQEYDEYGEYYAYSDEEGRLISLFITPDYPHQYIGLAIDKDYFDLSKIDTTNTRKSIREIGSKPLT